MIEKGKNFRVWLTGILVFAAGMAAGALWDLPLNHALYAPVFYPALFMECFGYYPLYLPALLWLWLTGPEKPGLRVAARIGCLIGAGVLFAVSVSNLQKRQVTGAIWHAAAVWLILVVLGVWLARVLRGKGPQLCRRLHTAMGWAVIYMILNNVIIQLLKRVWDRTRFDDMLAAGDFGAFTSWFEPFGNGGSSFPSGHTAAACGIFALVFVCDALPSWNRHRKLVWAVCWAYVAGMAVSRLIMGRHFLSDTVAAAFFMSLLLWTMRKSKVYQKSIAQ